MAQHLDVRVERQGGHGAVLVREMVQPSGQGLRVRTGGQQRLLLVRGVHVGGGDGRRGQEAALEQDDHSVRRHQVRAEALHLARPDPDPGTGRQDVFHEVHRHAQRAATDRDQLVEGGAQRGVRIVAVPQGPVVQAGEFDQFDAGGGTDAGRVVEIPYLARLSVSSHRESRGYRRPARTGS
ncbi:hypothetical protein ACIQU5_22510 [Streptomyces sp. NPDC090306]|uniref:hypothetical protein n=1 Tax=Streptomyces sp. NPDC090306 TaxID=3365961 RepID=UPI00381E45EF